MNITVDIDKLNVEQLQQLAAMTYEHGQMNETKAINDRIAVLEGWTK